LRQNSIKTIQNLDAEMLGRPVEIVCPGCGGTGYLRYDAPVGHPQFGQIVKCDICSIPARKNYLANNCGLEADERERMLDSWQVGNWSEQGKRDERIEAKKLMYTAVSKRIGFYTFYGEFGSGKSLALQVVCNELRDRLVDTYYTPFVGILDHLRSLYATGADSSEYWERLIDIPVLAIDEVTRFDDSKGFARERLFSLIDTRYRRAKSHLTIFSTNADPRLELPPTEDIGYLFSRMREGQIIRLSGDFRNLR
jgi:DNA replication protein DnaC